jgi:hypothetical protein
VPHDLQTLADVALAMLFGGVIGLERETANKPAGFRTPSDATRDRTDDMASEWRAEWVGTFVAPISVAC